MDDEDTELARLALWSLFAAATMTASLSARDAIDEADALLAAAEERFPSLKRGDPTGGLFPDQ